MICPMCGTNLPDGTEQCTSCGGLIYNSKFKKQKEEQGAAPKPQPQQLQQPTMKPASLNHETRLFCTNCGKKLPAVAGFCPSCGKPVVNKQIDQSNAHDTRIKIDDEPAQEPHKNSFKQKIIIITGILVMLTISLIIILSYKAVLDKKNKQQEKNNFSVIDANGEEQTTKTKTEATTKDKTESATNAMTIAATEADTEADTEAFAVESTTQPESSGLSTAKYFESAFASSVLADQTGKDGRYHTYVPDNVLYDDDACWTEGAKDYGTTEWIQLELPEKQKLYGLVIINGYNGDEWQYSHNSKVTDYKLEFSDGQYFEDTLVVYPTSERNTPQFIVFDSPVETTYVKFIIKGVDAGDISDTCISYIAPYVP
ncbi:MAG: zinc-ribbon domain-containing protein [Eubacterium sp.]|nr:zinc-ribbon domain-containing protein [Eubacterium sp.]